MSRSGQRQGYVVARMCTATPPPENRAWVFFRRFLLKFSLYTLSKISCQTKIHCVKIYERHPTVSLGP